MNTPKALLCVLLLSGCVTSAQYMSPEQEALSEARKICSSIVDPPQTSNTGSTEQQLEKLTADTESYTKEYKLCVNDKYVALLPSYMQKENNRIQRQQVSAMKCSSASSSFEKGLYCR